MPVSLTVQDPDESGPITLNWADMLDSDTISTSAWAVSPEGPTLIGESNTTTTATVTVADVTAGVRYRLKNTVTTASGATWERTVYVWGEHR